jgi:HK97 family phage major capsid protein
MPTNINARDDMVRRLEAELQEKASFANGIVERANAGNRDLSDDEAGLMAETRDRMGAIKSQLDQVEDLNRIAYETSNRAAVVDQAISKYKGQAQHGEVEYRTAGEWALDTYKGHLGDREANARLELYYRVAAHQKTSDNLGVIPDPIIGDLVNFIDAARPLVQVLGPKSLPGATWHRPVVTQHTAVLKQGTNGAPADEKTELTSQKMTITRLTGNAVTYGGYVNVSRQNIDFSQPSVLDIIINDLAAQYAIQTEAVTADAIAATTTAAVTYDITPAVDAQASVSGALWTASAQAYSAMKGQGRLVLVCSPTVLGYFGPLFAPINPQNAQGQGFSAAGFMQGVVGNISGISVVMSAGLTGNEAFLLSTASIEVYEQRVGTLQVTEPSVLGVQVAYAGYFTPMMINDDGIIPLVRIGT